MSLLQRIAREPNAIAGVIAAVYGLLVAFGVLELTASQVGAFVTLGGAVIVALRWLTTPSSEVVAQRKPGEPTVTGPGAAVSAGIPVQVTALGPGEPSPSERGAVDVGTAVLIAILVLLVLIVLGVGVNFR